MTKEEYFDEIAPLVLDFKRWVNCVVDSSVVNHIMPFFGAYNRAVFEKTIEPTQLDLFK